MESRNVCFSGNDDEDLDAVVRFFERRKCSFRCTALELWRELQEPSDIIIDTEMLQQTLQRLEVVFRAADASPPSTLPPRPEGGPGLGQAAAPPLRDYMMDAAVLSGEVDGRIASVVAERLPSLVSALDSTQREILIPIAAATGASLRSDTARTAVLHQLVTLYRRPDRGRRMSICDGVITWLRHMQTHNGGLHATQSFLRGAVVHEVWNLAVHESRHMQLLALDLIAALCSEDTTAFIRSGKSVSATPLLLFDVATLSTVVQKMVFPMLLPADTVTGEHDQDGVDTTSLPVRNYVVSQTLPKLVLGMLAVFGADPQPHVLRMAADVLLTCRVLHVTKEWDSMWAELLEELKKPGPIGAATSEFALVLLDTILQEAGRDERHVTTFQCVAALAEDLMITARPCFASVDEVRSFLETTLFPFLRNSTNGTTDGAAETVGEATADTVVRRRLVCCAAHLTVVVSTSCPVADQDGVSVWSDAVMKSLMPVSLAEPHDDSSSDQLRRWWQLFVLVYASLLPGTENIPSHKRVAPCGGGGTTSQRCARATSWSTPALERNASTESAQERVAPCTPSKLLMPSAIECCSPQPTPPPASLHSPPPQQQIRVVADEGSSRNAALVILCGLLRSFSIKYTDGDAQSLPVGLINRSLPDYEIWHAALEYVVRTATLEAGKPLLRTTLVVALWDCVGSVDIGCRLGVAGCIELLAFSVLRLMEATPELGNNCSKIMTECLWPLLLVLLDDRDALVQTRVIDVSIAHFVCRCSLPQQRRALLSSRQRVHARRLAALTDHGAPASSFLEWDANMLLLLSACGNVDGPSSFGGSHPAPDGWSSAVVLKVLMTLTGFMEGRSLRSRVLLHFFKSIDACREAIPTEAWEAVLYRFVGSTTEKVAAWLQSLVAAACQPLDPPHDNHHSESKHAKSSKGQLTMMGKFVHDKITAAGQAVLSVASVSATATTPSEVNSASSGSGKIAIAIQPDEVAELLVVVLDLLDWLPTAPAVAPLKIQSMLRQPAAQLTSALRSLKHASSELLSLVTQVEKRFTEMEAQFYSSTDQSQRTAEDGSTFLGKVRLEIKRRV